MINSWFIGMSNVEDPELVVSVIIESSDGTAKAVNVAKEIFRFVLSFRVRIWYRSDIMRDIVKKKCIEGRKICDTISICT